MSDTSQGPGWWLASDGKWYAPSPPVAAPDATPGAPGPKKKRPALKWSLIGVGALIVLFIIIGAVSGGSKKNTAATATTSPPVTTKPAPAVRTTVPPTVATTVPPTAPPTTAAPKAPTNDLNKVEKDGDFAFTVSGVQCGVTSIGTDPLTESAPAGSQWCLVNMTIMNDKTAAQTFFATNQKATDAKGNQLSADDTAAIYMPNGSASELSQLNPGISVTVTVPFQLPVGDSIKSLSLHDSAFSGGVTVRVS